MKGAPLIIFGFVLVAAVAAGGGYWYAVSHMASAKETAAPGGDFSGRKILYWYDPMVPQQHFDKPGKSPSLKRRCSGFRAGPSITPTMCAKAPTP